MSTQKKELNLIIDDIKQLCIDYRIKMVAQIVVDDYGTYATLSVGQTNLNERIGMCEVAKSFFVSEVRKNERKRE